MHTSRLSNGWRCEGNSPRQSILDTGAHGSRPYPVLPQAMACEGVRQEACLPTRQWVVAVSRDGDYPEHTPLAGGA
jgi:hypothetical protein